MKNKKNNILFMFLGIIVGLICAYLRQYVTNSFLGAYDMAGQLGFWCVSVCLIIYCSNSKKEASINTLGYLLFMVFSYYLFLYIDTKESYLGLTVAWSSISFICCLLASLVYKAKGNWRCSSIINSCYESLLIVEGILNLSYFTMIKEHLIIIIIDFLGAISLFFMYNKTKDKKVKTLVFTSCIIGIFMLGTYLINVFE